MEARARESAHVIVLVCFFEFGSRLAGSLPLSDYIRQYRPLNYDLHHLNHQHQMKRSLTNPSLVKLDFQAYGRTFRVRLKRDTQIYSPEMTVETSTGSIQFDKLKTYIGYIEGEYSHVYGTISMGLFTGAIHTQNSSYFLEPASFYFNKPLFHSVIYRHSDITLRWNTSLCTADRLYQTRHIEGTRNSFSHVMDEKLSFFNEYSRKEKPGRHFNYYRHRRNTFKQKTTCDLYLQADHLYYKAFNFNEEVVINQLTEHVQGVNAIYRPVDFDRDGLGDNIGFVIKKIKIHTDPKVKGYKFIGRHGVEKYLEIFSEENFNSFCLAYMFTYQDFEGGTLGLAWTADLTSAGGVCEKYGVSSSHLHVGIKPCVLYDEAGKLFSAGWKSLNTGVVTILNYGKVIPPAVSHVTLAHEIGHNMGSQHDPDTGICSPGGELGNYIMYAKATSGNKPNNDKFSTCSIKTIGPVLENKARSLSGCFIDYKGSICGNKVVEDDESCDCGWEDECKEKCCNPQTDNQSAIEPCTLRQDAQCSPSAGLCCNNKCQLYTIYERHVCQEESICRNLAYCNGNDAICPSSAHKANRTKCAENAVCYLGECTGSICLAYNMESCLCAPLEINDWNDNHLCHLCCKLPGESQECKSTFELNGIPNTLAQPSSPCFNYKGYCDSNFKCKEVDPSGPLSELQKMIYSTKGIHYLRDWLKSNWYVVSVGGIIVIICMATFVRRFCSKSTAAQIDTPLTLSPKSLRRHHPRPRHNRVSYINTGWV